LPADKKKTVHKGNFVISVIALSVFVFILNHSVSQGAQAYKPGYSKISEVWDVNVGLSMGLWVPTGKNSTLGAHPQFGFYMGAKACRFEPCVSFALRFASSANDYTVRYKGTQYSTGEYLGWYAGVDFGYEIFYTRKQGFLLLGGAGWDAFQAKTFSDDEYVWINSINLNTGLGYRLYYKETAESSYVEIDVKYNIIDYKNPGGTDLSGDAVTFYIAWGTILGG
jgi:hypothetical protein